MKCFQCNLCYEPIARKFVEHPPGSQQIICPRCHEDKVCEKCDGCGRGMGGAFVRALNVKADCVSAPMAAGELTTPVVGSSAGAVFGDEEPYSGGDQSGEFHGVSTQTLVFASCAAAVVVMISWTALGKQLAKAAAAREAEALEAGVVPSVGNAYQESSGLIN